MRRCRPHQGWTTHACRAARASSVLLIVSSVLAACGEPTNEPAEQPPLPEGVGLVEVTAAQLDDLPLWRFSGEPVVSIGRTVGEGEYLFFRVNAARRLDSGEIVVVDGQSRELRVFGEDGQFRRAYGGRGEGPGEFAGSPLTVSASDGRRVAIYDVPVRRITEIDLLSGDFTTRLLPAHCPLPGEADPGSCSLAGLLPKGTVFVSRGSAPLPPVEDGSLTIRPSPYFLFGLLEGDTTPARFRTLDSIRGTTRVSVGLAANLFSGAALFEPGGAAGFGTTGLVLGDPHEFELRVWDGDGTLRRVIRVRAPPTPVTDDLLDRYRSWADTASGLPEATHLYLASLEPTGAVPFFGGLFLDRAERIWVQDYRPFWAFGPRGPAAWTVFGADGEPLARIEGGAPGIILEAGEDYVLVRATDELGVEQVRMYAIERPPATREVSGR